MMTSSNETLTGQKILLVDDESLIRLVLGEALTIFGAEVEIVNSGEEALILLGQQSFDLLLTDLNMPIMDGLQLLAQAKEKYPELQAIVISGQDEVALAVKAMELGANSYLRKPVELIELRLACERAIEKKRLLMEVKDNARMQLRLQQVQKLEAVGQLAAGIAHEINTPTQYVASNIEFLQDAFVDLAELITMLQTIQTASSDAQAAEVAKSKELLADMDWEYLSREIPSALQQSKEGVERVSSIVRAMKEFSHPGSKNKGLIDINHLIKNTVIVARNEWKYVAEVNTELQPDLPKLFCLASEISQVILILLVNGAQAIAEKIGTNPSGEKGHISISTKIKGDRTEISCTDTGGGMSTEVQRRIFEPFFTTKKVGQGTGQGLAIAWDIIVRKHDGTLEMTSKEGIGSTFVLSLPNRGEEE